LGKIELGDKAGINSKGLGEARVLAGPLQKVI